MARNNEVNEQKCSRCGAVLTPVWFKDTEWVDGHRTGRTRMAVSHFECHNCLAKQCVDNTFDGPWRYEN